jgi:hypothetical protein
MIMPAAGARTTERKAKTRIEIMLHGCRDFVLTLLVVELGAALSLGSQTVTPDPA